MSSLPNITGDPALQIAGIAHELKAACDHLAGAHYGVQQLAYDLDVPTPEVLALLTRLTIATAAVHDTFTTTGNQQEGVSTPPTVPDLRPGERAACSPPPEAHKSASSTPPTTPHSAPASPGASGASTQTSSTTPAHTPGHR